MERFVDQVIDTNMPTKAQEGQGENSSLLMENYMKKITKEIRGGGGRGMKES